MTTESTATTTETPSGAVAEEGRTSLSMDWRNNITDVAPDYVGEWDEFKNADSAEKFFDQLKHHRSMLGQSVRIPSNDAGAEAMNEFYNKIQTKVPGLMRTPDPDDAEQVRNTFSKLGLPEKSDDYNVPTNSGIDAETLGSYKALAHEAGLTKIQFAQFIGKLAERNAHANNERESAQSEDLAGLRGEWGQAFEQRAGICAKVAQRTGAPQQLCEAIEAGQADAKTMKWLYDLSTQLGQGEGMNFTGNDPSIESPTEVQGRIDDIMSNPQHPYWHSSHPSHKQAVDRMLELRRQLAS
jgi:hypothetical protein